MNSTHFPTKQRKAVKNNNAIKCVKKPQMKNKMYQKMYFKLQDPPTKCNNRL